MALRNKIESYLKTSPAFNSMSEQEQNQRKKLMLTASDDKMEQIINVFQREQESIADIEKEFEEKDQREKAKAERERAEKENKKQKIREKFVKKEAIERQNDDVTASKLLEDLDNII